MGSKSPKLRNRLAVLLAISLFACPLALGSTLSVHPAGAATPFQTVRPQRPNFTPAVGDFEPIPTAIPTLFPGQYFEGGDASRPIVDEDVMEGDRQFGFQRLSENPELYMVWMTDQDGTHYMIVGSDSDVLTGGNDPESGFLFLARERKRIHADIATTVDNRDAYLSSATDLRWGAIVALGATAVCTFLAGPLCLVGLGLAGGAYWASRSQDTNAQVQQNILEALQDQLSDVEGDLQFGFRIGQATEPQS